MKRIVLGGFAFVGGAVMYSISTLGFAHVEVQLYCRPPGFTLMLQGKYLAGGLQSGCTANSTGVQYK